MPAPTPPETIARILQLRQQGCNGSQIAKQVDLSVSAVCRILKGHRPSPPTRSWDLAIQGTKEEIQEKLNRGYSVNYLAKAYGIPYRRIDNDLQHPEFRGKTGFDKIAYVGENMIEEYVNNRLGSRDIAQRYGLAEKTVAVFFQSRGLLKARGAQQGTENPQSKGNSTDNERYHARQVVEFALRRKPPKGWVIHHMNEVPSDQTLGNLWLFPNNTLHLEYHQSQLANLQQGGLQAPSRLATDKGGLWLPLVVSRLQESPDTELHDLCDRPEGTKPGQQEFLLERGLRLAEQ